MKPSTIFTSVFVIIAVVLLVVIVKRYQLSQRMRVAQGEIVGNVTIDHGLIGISKAATYNVKITYEYKVNGIILRGHLLSLNGNSFASRNEAESILKTIKHNESVTVWYDPENPEYSILLEPRVDRRICLYLLGCVVFSYCSKYYLDSILYFFNTLKK